MADNHEIEVQRFRAAQRATRLHLLTVITPFAPTLNRFMLIEGEAGATLRRCLGCRLSAPLDQGDSESVPADNVAAFLRAVENAESAWGEDAVPDGVLDGVTLIAERATAQGYDITHMVAPRGTSPHARLLRAWIESFPDVQRALG